MPTLYTANPLYAEGKHDDAPPRLPQPAPHRPPARFLPHRVVGCCRHIGDISGIAIPTFLNQKKKAVDGVVTSELKTLASVLASSMVADNVVVSAGADGNPTSNSGNVTIDGTAVPEERAIVFVNTSTNPKQWCVSRQSSSGRIYSASNTNRSVREH